jgi:hypothetical protein
MVAISRGDHLVEREQECRRWLQLEEFATRAY